MAVLDNPVTRVGTAVIITGLFMALLIALLPITPLPNQVSTSLDWLFENIWLFNFMIPVSTFITCFGLIITIEIAFAGIKFLLFAKKHLTQQH